MGSYNKIILIGNIARDNSVKNLENGTILTVNAIAINSPQKSDRQETVFIEFKIFNQKAETFARYTGKGSKVLLEGYLTMDSWTAKDGSKRVTPVVIVNNFVFLSTKSDYAPSYPSKISENDL